MLYCETYWLISDHLGTPRLIAERTGKLEGIKRSDYLPFGESANQLGGRANTQGYAGESVRQGFTGYEEDAETGLDYAQARYLSSAQGRFISVDPLMASAATGEPQSWNRYVYVSNNPLNLTDPTGMSSKGTSGILELPQPAQPRSDSQSTDGAVTETPQDPPQSTSVTVTVIGEGVIDTTTTQGRLEANFVNNIQNPFAQGSTPTGGAAAGLVGPAPTGTATQVGAAAGLGSLGARGGIAGIMIIGFILLPSAPPGNPTTIGSRHFTLNGMRSCVAGTGGPLLLPPAPGPIAVPNPQTQPAPAPQPSSSGGPGGPTWRNRDRECSIAYQTCLQWSFGRGKSARINCQRSNKLCRESIDISVPFPNGIRISPQKQ